jgi:hypothetical protein
LIPFLTIKKFNFFGKKLAKDLPNWNILLIFII